MGRNCSRPKINKQKNTINSKNTFARLNVYRSHPQLSTSLPGFSPPSFSRGSSPTSHTQLSIRRICRPREYPQLCIRAIASAIYTDIPVFISSHAYFRLPARVIRLRIIRRAL